jgi:hypothetical protein
MSTLKTFASLTKSRWIKERHRETVKTVPHHSLAALTAINRGVNEKAFSSLF